MSKFIVLVSVGLGLIVGGLYFHLWDDAANEYLDDYMRDNPRNDSVQLLWDIIPVVLLLVGVICLIMGGKSRGAGVEVSE